MRDTAAKTINEGAGYTVKIAQLLQLCWFNNGWYNMVITVNSMWITGTITTKQKVRQKVPGLYAVCR